MNKEQRNVRTKSWYVFKNIILFSVVFLIVCTVITDFVNTYMTWTDVWEIGFVGTIIFALLYIIDSELFLFRIDTFNEFMLGFFLSFLLSDWMDFLIFMGMR